MAKQRGLGQSNQKELTQKGDEHKEEKQSPRAEQQAQHSKQSGSASLSVSVTWLTASWPDGYSNGSAAVSTDRLYGDLVVRNCHVVSNRPVALNRQVVTNRHVILNRPLQCPHPLALFWSPASSLRARTVVVGARSVTRPLTGDNCAVRAHCRELRRLNRCLPITARGRHVWLFSRLAWETMTRIVRRVQSLRGKQASAAGGQVTRSYAHQ